MALKLSISPISRFAKIKIQITDETFIFVNNSFDIRLIQRLNFMPLYIFSMFWGVIKSKCFWFNTFLTWFWSFQILAIFGCPICVKIYVKSDSDPLKHYRNHCKEIFLVTQGRPFGSIWSSVQLMLIFFGGGG